MAVDDVRVSHGYHVFAALWYAGQRVHGRRCDTRLHLSNQRPLRHEDSQVQRKLSNHLRKYSSTALSYTFALFCHTTGFVVVVVVGRWSNLQQHSLTVTSICMARTGLFARLGNKLLSADGDSTFFPGQVLHFVWGKNTWLSQLGH